MSLRRPALRRPALRRPTLLLALSLLVSAVAVVGTALTAALAPSPASALPATQVTYVRPVTESGRPASGWTATSSSTRVTCSGTASSAVNPGIAACYPTALGLTACFRSTVHTVLCVRDVTDKRLVRLTFTGRYPTGVAAPARPTPAATDLTDGRRCLVRTGGAWGSPKQHPDWVGFSSCTGQAATYGSGLGNGVDARTSAWTVRLWRTAVDPEGRDLVTRRVTRAWFVGIAAD